MKTQYNPDAKPSHWRYTDLKKHRDENQIRTIHILRDGSIASDLLNEAQQQETSSGKGRVQ